MLFYIGLDRHLHYSNLVFDNHPGSVDCRINMVLFNVGVCTHVQVYANIDILSIQTYSIKQSTGEWFIHLDPVRH